MPGLDGKHQTRPSYQMELRRLSIHDGGDLVLKFGTRCLFPNDGSCDVRLETRDVFDLKRSDGKSWVLACSAQAEDFD
jgi:hypothetical protein